MKCEFSQRETWRASLALTLLACVLAAASSAQAQLLYSFETGLEGWGPTGFTGSDLLSVSQATEGFTDGTHSMAVERGKQLDTSPRSWDVNIPAATEPQFAIFQNAAANPDRYALDFDVTLTANSFGGGVVPGPTFLISVAVNSSAAGEGNFDQILDIAPVGEDENLIGPGDMPELGTHHYSIPLASAPGGNGLYLVPNSTYYQFTIGSTLTNALFQNGTGGRGAIYYVDNIHFRELPETVEYTVFSWETQDDPGTPDVNEQFEGWVGGNFPGNPPHNHAITTVGATHGTHALEIDRTTVTTQDFTWGSMVRLVADTNPDPEVEEIDPVIQARISDLIARLEGGESIAFDVHYEHQDLFPLPDPTYVRFAVHFTDETGVFYQKSADSIDLLNVTELDTTVEIPLDQFIDANTGTLNLKTDGFVDDSGFLRIGISTSTDGAQFYQIDNFRIISLASAGLLGDFNEDGSVDAADYVTWRKNGANSPLPNDDGLSTQAERYALWVAHFGESSSGGGSSGQLAAVPEPATAWLLLLAAAAGTFAKRRK